jgi:hypothetical protein
MTMRVLLVVLFVSFVSSEHCLRDFFPTLAVLVNEDDFHSHLALEETPMMCAASLVMKDVVPSSFWLECSDERLQKSLLIASTRLSKKLVRDSVVVRAVVKEVSNSVVKVELSVENSVLTGECVDARWITALVFSCWLLAAVFVWWCGEVLPFLALISSFLAPLVIQQGLFYVPLSSSSPATRFPLALLLILSHVLIPAALAAFVCLKTAPHLITHAMEMPDSLSRTAAVIGFGAAVRFVQASMISTLHLSPDVIGCGFALVLCSFQVGKKFLESPQKSAFWFVCGTLSLIGMATSLSIFVLPLVTVLSALLLFHKKQKTLAVVAVASVPSLSRPVVPNETPKTLAQLSAVIKELPLVGERLKVQTICCFCFFFFF